MKSRHFKTAASSQRNPGRPRRIVILAVPPVEELDVVGPVEVFSMVNRACGFQRPPYNIEVVTTESRRLIEGQSGLSILAHGHFRNIRGSIDTLLVSGGVGARTERRPTVINWVRTIAPKARRVVSVCTGTFLLAAAGLLKGKRATTHWAHCENLATLYPDTKVEPDPIWIQDGSIYTSAGISAGMDLVLALVEQDFGSSVALQAARRLVLFLRRPGGQAQFSSSLRAQITQHRPFQELQVWILENLQNPLTVEILADQVSMSPRNFCRVFTREFQITPARYIEQMRVEAARSRLEQSAGTQKEIALACGFGSAESMRCAFQRALNMSPGRYSEHFRSAACGGSKQAKS